MAIVDRFCERERGSENRNEKRFISKPERKKGEIKKKKKEIES
jgi:hypothetical protein